MANSGDFLESLSLIQVHCILDHFSRMPATGESWRSTVRLSEMRRRYYLDDNRALLTRDEKQCLHKFFSAVNKALGARMIVGFNPNEEHLTSMLCEMLDSTQTSLHNLDYSWQQMQDELRGRSGFNAIKLELQVNEHSRQFEGRFSYADLGVVFRWRNNFNGSLLTKAVLVQAKKLFAGRGYAGRS